MGYRINWRDGGQSKIYKTRAEAKKAYNNDVLVRLLNLNI